ncbi:MAG: hypothetical protein M3024_11760 [Candidatus Dormibacteraeota bacterium]|nr:hypothetical protein [Candidatus Dormibacteraeota bacterium]
MNMGEHGAAIVALPWLAVAVFALVWGLEWAAGRGSNQAERYLVALYGLGPVQILALLLLAASATIHLALAPTHAGEPVTAVLFVLDGIVELTLCLAAPLIRNWRAAAIGLLAANLFAYALYLLLGLETADAVGLATKVVEFGAIALLALTALRLGATLNRGPKHTTEIKEVF